MTDARGATLLDTLFASALCMTMTAIAVPVVGGSLDRERTIVGAQYLAGQLQRARLESLKQARSVAVRLEIVDQRARLQLFVDGNGNGVSQRDIDRAIDPPLTPPEFLDDRSRDVSLRINQRIVDVSGAESSSHLATIRCGSAIPRCWRSVRWAAPRAGRYMSRLTVDRRWRFVYSEEPAVFAC